MNPTVTIPAYAPKPMSTWRLDLYKTIPIFKQEAENLLYLLCNTESPGKIIPNTNIGAEVWRTTCCDLRTGEFLNPHVDHGKRVVADLLRGSPRDFVEWARNAPATQHLPITKNMPNWVDLAASRLSRCARHPMDTADVLVSDLSQAKALLSKFF